LPVALFVFYLRFQMIVIGRGRLSGINGCDRGV
jgi:hypothetical protein